ncbi:MAG: hypothetical protein RL264_2273 [Bacteroidota bacterium]
MNTSELIRTIRQIEIKTKGLTKHIFSGQYKSAFRGRGMAFSEVREYQSGDEIRTIDWNVTARYQTPFVKVFEEERELTILLSIDLSGSFEVGLNAQSKKQRLIEVAATLAFSALKNNDKVGAILFTESVELYIPPKKGREHVLLILRQLLEFKPKKKGTEFKEMFSFIRNTQKKRTVSFLISDFETDFSKEDFQRTAKTHDLIAIKIENEADFSLPISGYIQLFNAETGVTSWVNASSEHTNRLLKKEFEFRTLKWEENLRNCGVDAVRIASNGDFIPELIQLFKRRR